MTIDPDDQVDRDDLAPTKRLHIIAALLAEGIRRRRADAQRIGDSPPHQEREATSLALLEPVRPCGGRG